MTSGFVQTFSKKRFKFDEILQGGNFIDIDDIAHSLSLINRFNGHTSLPRSVAAHSIHVAEIVPDEFKLTALLHDAQEAYVGDMVRDLKVEVAKRTTYFNEMEDRVAELISQKYGCIFPLPKEVVKADNTMLYAEGLLYFGKECIDDWTTVGIRDEDVVGIQMIANDIQKRSNYGPTFWESMYKRRFEEYLKLRPNYWTGA